MAYPNPDSVRYPTGQPLAYPCQLTTRSAGRIYPMHTHGAWLDKDGGGNTDLESGHFHRVRNFKVMADESDGHTHELTMLPCGAGAARTTGRNGPIENGLVAQGGTTAMVSMQGAHGGGFPWGWVVGGVVVVGIVIAGVMMYKHAQEDGGGEA